MWPAPHRPFLKEDVQVAGAEAVLDTREFLEDAKTSHTWKLQVCLSVVTESLNAGRTAVTWDSPGT